MDAAKLKPASREHDLNLDLIRSVAIFSLFFLHYPLYTGFYGLKAAVGLKALFDFLDISVSFSVVPLFLMLSGFLLSERRFDRKHIFGLERVLAVYLICSVICIVGRFAAGDYQLSIGTFVSEILNFSGARYGWYVEMYIGLYLLMPFFNSLYRSLKTFRLKSIFILALLLICSIPITINRFISILPDYWTSLYPIVFYFIGIYLRDTDIKFKKPGFGVLTLALCVALNFAYRLLLFYGKKSDFPKYITLPEVLVVTVLFVLLRSVRLDKLPKSLKGLISSVSSASYAMYLLACLFEAAAYKMFLAPHPTIGQRVLFILVTLPAAAFCSYLSARFTQWVYGLLHKARIQIFINLHIYELARRVESRIRAILLAIIKIIGRLFNLKEEQPD